MAQFPSALQVPRLIRILERDCRGIKHADFNPDLPCLFFSEAKYWSNHGYPDLFCNYSNFNPDHFILFGQNTLRYKCFTLTSQELSNPIFPCPLRHFAMERCYLQLWWYFFSLKFLRRKFVLMELVWEDAKSIANSLALNRHLHHHEKMQKYCKFALDPSGESSLPSLLWMGDFGCKLHNHSNRNIFRSPYIQIAALQVTTIWQ